MSKTRAKWYLSVELFLSFVILLGAIVELLIGNILYFVALVLCSFSIAEQCYARFKYPHWYYWKEHKLFNDNEKKHE